MIPIIATNQNRPKNAVALVQWMTMIMGIIVLMQEWVSNTVFYCFTGALSDIDEELLP